MTSATIRPAHASDSPAMKRVIDAAYAPFIGEIANMPDVSAGLDEDIANNIAFVIEDAGQILGCMILVTQEDHLKLANIATAPKAAGQGLASQLLSHATALAQQRGLSHLRLNTHVDMATNIGFYTRRGWVETGRAGVTVMMEKPV